MVKTRKNFFAHDENQSASKGDMVKIQESRPLSKMKHFVLLEILQKAETYTDPITGHVFTKA
jgi:small subunit ribosomal protein S17